MKRFMDTGRLARPPEGAFLALAFIVVLAFTTGCAGPGERGEPPQAKAPGTHVEPLFRARTAHLDGWQHAALNGKTEWRLVALDGEVALRAVGRGSASGLVRRVRFSPDNCRRLRWRWRVDALQASADLRTKAREDVAASLFVFFGDPGMLSAPNRVPTLRYVWSNGRVEPGEIVDNPYLPGIVKSLVVRAGRVKLDTWVEESRDLRRDYAAAFGEAPADDVRAIALFTDNDQTGEPVRAYYQYAEALCDRPPQPAFPGQ